MCGFRREWRWSWWSRCHCWSGLLTTTKTLVSEPPLQASHCLGSFASSLGVRGLRHKSWSSYSWLKKNHNSMATIPDTTRIQKTYGGMESETMLTSRGKSPLLEAERRFEPVTQHHAGQGAQHTTDWAVPAPASCRTGSPTHCRLSCSSPCIMQNREPNTLPTELFQPLHHAEQGAQHTTDWAVPAPASCRTGSPTHYRLSCSSPCIMQDREPNTLPTELFQPLHHAGQGAQHTTDWAVPAPASCRTGSPTHYRLSCSSPCIMQNREPNTLPTELFQPLHHAEQGAQHTTDWAIPGPSGGYIATHSNINAHEPFPCVKMPIVVWAVTRV